MKIIAHRCGTDKFPELTVEAAQYSLSNGAAYVEMDIRKTSDGVLVVCHDKTARRLFGDEREISEMTLSEFLSLRHVCDNAYPAYSVEDFLKAGVRSILFHVKEGGDNVSALIAICEEYGLLGDAVFGLVSPGDITAARRLCPDVKILAFMPLPDDIEAFAAAGADYIRLWEDWITPDSVRRVRETGKKLWVMAGSPFLPGYTDKENLTRWEREGVDAVLINEVVQS